MAFDKIKLPVNGEKITVDEEGVLDVPNQPVVSFIEGDASDIWLAAQSILDAAVSRAYQGERNIAWMEVYAGEKAWNLYGKCDDAWLPTESLQALNEYKIALKGSLVTPAGCAIDALNMALRQQLDLYVGLCSVRYFAGAPSPMLRPQDVSMVFFRACSEAVSRESTQRLVRAAIQYAIEHKHSSVTLVHQSGVMKQAQDWAYDVAKEDFSAVKDADGSCCKLPNGIVIKDCMADIALQKLLISPAEFDVVVSLSTDCLLDVAVAQVGGVGIVPSAYINDESSGAIFEASHGAAPIDVENMTNPSSLALSGAMMLRYMGWDEAAALIEKGILGAIKARAVTADFEQQMDDVVLLSTADFAIAVVDHMDDAAVSGEDTEQYDALAAKFKELFESSADKTSDLAHGAMEKARQQLTVAGAFTEEQGQKLKGFLERDFGQIATDVRDEAKLKLNPSRLGSGALASISSLLQVAGSALSGVAEKTEQSLSCRSGEITSAGTLTCKSCKHSMRFKKTGRIPPCPSCHKTDFSKGY